MTLATVPCTVVAYKHRSTCLEIGKVAAVYFKVKSPHHLFEMCHETLAGRINQTLFGTNML